MADAAKLQSALVNADRAYNAAVASGDDATAQQAATDARALARALKSLQAPQRVVQMRDTVERGPTMQEASPFDPNVVERGDVFYPYGKTTEGEEVLAWPTLIKDLVEGAMMPGHLAGGGTATEDEMRRAAMAITPTGSGLVGGVKPKMRARTSMEIKKDASKLYKEAERTPAILGEQGFDGLLNSVSSKLDQEAITPKGYPKVWGVLRDMQKYKGRDMPMKRLMAHLRILNKDVSPDEARVAGIVSDHIKKYVAENGGPEAADALAKLGAADRLWAQGSTQKMFESAIQKARRQASGFENGLRIEFRKILNKAEDDKLYLQPEVKAALEKVVDGTIPANRLRDLGKFGFGIGQNSNALMTALLAMSSGGAYVSGNPALAAGVAGLGVAGQAGKMGALSATRKSAENVLRQQGGQAPTGQHGIKLNAPVAAAPRVLGTQVQEGPQGILYDEYGPLL